MSRAGLPNTAGVRRRTAVQGIVVAGVGVPLLAACSADDAEEPAEDSDSAEEPTPDAASEGASDGGTDAPAALAKTADVAVGGGLIAGNVVIAQPAAGDFKGWSAVCPHQQCKFTEVADNRIKCGGCHQAEFDAATGKNLVGPGGDDANLPNLSAIELAVDGDAISLA
ncbi:MAG: Rieske (2Fe-2S) protein [Nocardioides sp.]